MIELGANAVSAGAISAAGEALTGGDAKAGFANGAIGGALGNGAGKVLEKAAPGLTSAIGRKAADTVNGGFEAAASKGLPVTGGFPPVASPSVTSTVVGEAIGNSAGAVGATSTCAVVSDPC